MIEEIIDKIAMFTLGAVVLAICGTFWGLVVYLIGAAIGVW